MFNILPDGGSCHRKARNYQVLGRLSRETRALVSSELEIFPLVWLSIELLRFNFVIPFSFLNFFCSEFAGKREFPVFSRISLSEYFSKNKRNETQILKYAVCSNKKGKFGKILFRTKQCNNNVFCNFHSC